MSSQTDPIEVRSAEDAFSSLTSVSRYPSPGRDGERYLPQPDVRHEAQFTIDRTDKIFTIGSCFARNIERALRNLDFDVLSSYVDGLVGQENISNKYTSRSILNDLNMILEPGELSDEKLMRTIYADKNDQARNLAFGGAGSVKKAPLDEVVAKSRAFYSNLKKVWDADLVILTFGLVEIWYDKESRVHLNVPPSIREIKSNPSRFELHVLSYEQVLEDMNAILDLVAKHGKLGANVLCTISPVPLHNTFRDQDCLQANCYSKSVQRAAIEAALRGRDRVAYFPSYEMVTLSAPNEAWIPDDFRHVKPEAVDRIMRKVFGAYCEASLLPPDKNELSQMRLDKKYTQTIDMISAYLNASGRKLEDMPIFMRYYYGAACLHLDRVSEGLPWIKSVLTERPSHPNAKKYLNRYS